MDFRLKPRICLCVGLTLIPSPLKLATMVLKKIGASSFSVSRSTSLMPSSTTPDTALPLSPFKATFMKSGCDPMDCDCPLSSLICTIELAVRPCTMVNTDAGCGPWLTSPDHVDIFRPRTFNTPGLTSTVPPRP